MRPEETVSDLVFFN